MNFNHTRYLAFIGLFYFTTLLSAQGIKRLFEDGSFSGLVQADVQYCLKDSTNDRSEYVNKFLSSVLVEGSYISK